jgi:hydroxymethylpyrimidine/phosphomethylpyrimidine kinase
MKKVLTIAGSDCSGGAGIQADLKTFAAHGVFGMSAITSVVAENTCRLLGQQDVSPVIVEKQIEAVFEDIGADAVKTGMLPTASCMKAVAHSLRRYGPSFVVADPVMVAKSGASLMSPDAVDTFVREILPLADVLTPNIPEAEALAGGKIEVPEDMERAAEAIQKMGAKSVLVKGGHASGDALDILYDGAAFHRFRAARIPTKNTHGTGCTYSSAIASNLALGYPLPEAVRRAKDYVTTAILHAPGLGKGSGPTHHFYDLYRHGLPEKGD